MTGEPERKTLTPEEREERLRVLRQLAAPPPRRVRRAKAQAILRGARRERRAQARAARTGE